jgi:hypothetical protein
MWIVGAAEARIQTLVLHRRLRHDTFSANVHWQLRRCVLDMSRKSLRLVSKPSSDSRQRTLIPGPRCRDTATKLVNYTVARFLRVPEQFQKAPDS